MADRKYFLLTSRDIRQRALDALIATPADGTMEALIRPAKRDKTAEQRNWFHRLCEIAGEAYGVPGWKVKEAVKVEMFGQDVVTIGGKPRVVTRSSESLSRKEYAEMIERLIQMAAEDGIVLPLTYSEQEAHEEAVRLRRW